MLLNPAEKAREKLDALPKLNVTNINGVYQTENFQINGPSHHNDGKDPNDGTG